MLKTATNITTAENWLANGSLFKWPSKEVRGDVKSIFSDLGIVIEIVNTLLLGRTNSGIPFVSTFYTCLVGPSACTETFR